SESVEIPETLFEEPEHVEMKSSAFKGVHKEDSKDEKSEDPFNIYAMLNKKKPGNSVTQQSKGDLQYPPGFTPCDRSKVNSHLDHVDEFSGKGADSTAIYTENVNTSVGQAMGYKMEGCMNDIEEIVKSQGDHEFYK
ncbi:hypothetical protein Tco_0720418, partial [Tanacetum coccineum]